MDGRIRRALGAYRFALRFQGPRGMMWKAVEAALSPFGDVGLEGLCVKDLTGALASVEAKVPITVSTATEEDIAELIDMVTLNWGAHPTSGPYARLGIEGTIRDRRRRGQRCFVGRVGDQIAHYNWVAVEPEETIAATGLYIDPEGRGGICHDGFTREEFRGKGIHPAVHNEMLRHLQRSGYQKAYTVVGAFDRSANITHHRLGWEFTGIMFYFISRRSGRARTWRVRGTLHPFDRPLPPRSVVWTCSD